VRMAIRLSVRLYVCVGVFICVSVHTGSNTHNGDVLALEKVPDLFKTLDPNMKWSQDRFMQRALGGGEHFDSHPTRGI
jgi:hypothetical protein